MRRFGLGVMAVVVVSLAVPAASGAAEPAGPGNVRVTDVRASGATLTWSPPIDARGLYGYDIVDLDNPAVNNGVGWTFQAPGDARLEPNRTYRLAVVASYIDRSFSYSRPSAPVTVRTPPDTTPPGTPSLRQDGQTSTSVSLAWGSGGDDVGVETFIVSNGVRTWEFPAWRQWWGAVTGLETNRTHTFTVRTRDAAGNLSAASNAVSATIENRPPTAPTNLRVAGDELVWDAATDDSGRIVAYRVEVDGLFHTGAFATRAPLRVLDDSTGDIVPAPGVHTYTVRAQDPSGNLSAPSAPLTVDVR